jgi:FAD/FMN-containing dehydrogenase
MSLSVHVQACSDLLDDGSRTDRQRWLFPGSTFAVLRPTTTRQVSDIVRPAAHQGIGNVPQGGNTSYTALRRRTPPDGRSTSEP